MRFDRLRKRVSTVLADAGFPGARAHGVYVPYAHANALDAREAQDVAWVRALFDASAPAQREHLRAAAAYAPVYARFRDLCADTPTAPRLDQDWFPGLDAAMAYALVRSLGPARIVEVGSGHSTRWLAQAVADAGSACRLVSIDPQPRRDIDALCDEVIRLPLERAPRDAFESLNSGDVLFIDSSHVALEGSDVDLLFTHILPTLPAGVVVHVHDVFLPFAYPAAWRKRRYSEQLVVAALLAGGERYEVLAAHQYLRRCHADAIDPLGVDIAAHRFESSLWLRKRA